MKSPSVEMKLARLSLSLTSWPMLPAVLCAIRSRLRSSLADTAFTSQASAFYGGQKVNEFFAGVSDTVDKDFTWLPFMDFVNSSFTDTLGKAVANAGDLRAGLTTWQNQVVSYAKQQGFTVK